MVEIKIKLIAISCILLTGCQVVTTEGKKTVSMLPFHIPKEEQFLNIPSSATKKEKIDAYVNQLITDDDKFSTVKTIPYAFYQGSGSLTPFPYTLYSFDNKRVKFVDNALFSSSSLRRFDYSQSKLKLPTGIHDLVFVNGIGGHSYYTELKGVKLEAGKDYIVGIDRDVNNKGQIFIAEYDIDSRFSDIEPESIIIKNKIIKGIESGNLKYVRVY